MRHKTLGTKSKGGREGVRKEGRGSKMIQRTREWAKTKTCWKRAKEGNMRKHEITRKRVGEETDFDDRIGKLMMETQADNKTGF